MAKCICALSILATALILPAQNRVTCTTAFNQVTCYQPPDYVAPILDAMKSAADHQLKMRQLQLQKEALDVQKEQLRLAQDRQRASEERQQQPSEQQQEAVRAEIDKLLRSLRDRHPDLGLYEARMAELVDSFLPGKNVSPSDYIEGLYFIAKHAAEAKSHQ